MPYFLRENSFSQESKCNKYVGVFLLGPFTSTEMAEWFSAGYFTMNLLVKRGCDDIFQPLGELIKRWGRVPFLSGPTPPPLKVRFIFTACIRRMGNVLFSQEWGYPMVSGPRIFPNGGTPVLSLVLS